MKKAIQAVIWGVLGFLELIIGFLSGYFLFFAIGGFFSVGTIHEEGDLAIYVKTNGVHTDICLPVETDYFDWKTLIPPTDFPANNKFEFVSIGWGDKGFFLDTPEWSDLTFSTAFNAAFLNSPTAMHVIYWEREPVVSSSSAKVFISESNYRNLITFIKESFKMENESVVLIPNRGYWSNDNFYEANGNYHLFNTCNRWTNRALKILDVQTGWFALSSEGIMRHLR